MEMLTTGAKTITCNKKCLIVIVLQVVQVFIFTTVMEIIPKLYSTFTICCHIAISD